MNRDDENRKEKKWVHKSDMRNDIMIYMTGELCNAASCVLDNDGDDEKEVVG